MQNIFIIAQKFLQEARRNNGIISAIFTVVLLLLIIPFGLKSDDTLKSHLQLVLNYSLSILAMLVYGISLFFSVHSFNKEIKTKQYYLLEVKPLQRWEFYWGKFFGVAMLNALLLLIFGSIVYGLLFYWKSSQGTQAEQEKISEELFIPYSSILPNDYSAEIEQQVIIEFEKDKRENVLPDDLDERSYKRKLRKKFELQQQVVLYNYTKNWIFQNIPPHFRNSSTQLKIRYKFFAAEAPMGYLCEVNWQIGRGASQYIYRAKVKPEEYYEFSIPSSTIQTDHTLEIRFFNTDPKAGVIFFPPQEDIELLYPNGYFIVNYFNGLLLIYFISCFLAATGLFAATFLDFSVALLFGLCILLLGSAAGFILEILPNFSNLQPEHSIFSMFSAIFLKILYGVIPNFSEYSPQDALSSGRLISWTTTIYSFFNLIIIRTGIIGVLGCLIFSNREIGRPTI